MSDVKQLELDLEAAASEYGRNSPEAMAVRMRLLPARNDAAKLRGEIYLRPVDPNVGFEPNDPNPRLLRGRSTMLIINPHFDDADDRLVCLKWNSCVFASFSPPNDEGVARSRLGPLGLGWWHMVEAGNSPLVTFLSDLTALHELKHFILLLRDQLFHAVALGYEIERLPRQALREVDQALSLIDGHGRNDIFDIGSQ